MLFAISSCNTGTKQGVKDNTGKLRIEKFYARGMFQNAEVLENQPLVDTLFDYAVGFPNDTVVRMMYVSSGDCSVCIASMLDFLKEYTFLKDELPLFVLFKAESRELLDYYIEKYDGDFEQKNIGRIANLKILTMSSFAESEDGLYLLKGNRVIEHMVWVIRNN